MSRSAAKNPCGTCPYRRDVPSGVWAPEEYAKLPPYDAPTGEQPTQMFACHQQDGRLCAGWVGCHDMEQSLSFRLAASMEEWTEEEVDVVLDYTTEVPLFSSGQEAFEHGMAEVEEPTWEARRKINNLLRKQRTQ